MRWTYSGCILYIHVINKAHSRTTFFKRLTCAFHRTNYQSSWNTLTWRDTCQTDIELKSIVWRVNFVDRLKHASFRVFLVSFSSFPRLFSSFLAIDLSCFIDRRLKTLIAVALRNMKCKYSDILYIMTYCDNASEQAPMK